MTGPESAGNRLLAAVLIRAGCAGQASTAQAWDRTLPNGESPAVVIRSMPHGRARPNISRIWARLQSRGYQATVLVTARHPAALGASMAARGHAASERKATEKARAAYRRIFATMGAAPFYVVPYETLVGGPEPVRALLRLLGLPPVTDGPVTIDLETHPIADRNPVHF